MKEKTINFVHYTTFSPFENYYRQKKIGNNSAFNDDLFETPPLSCGATNKISNLRIML